MSAHLIGYDPRKGQGGSSDWAEDWARGASRLRQAAKERAGPSAATSAVSSTEDAGAALDAKRQSPTQRRNFKVRSLFRARAS